MTTDAKIDLIFKQVNATNDSVNDMKVELAKHLVHQDQHRKELDVHKVQIDSLVAVKNKGIGVAIFGGMGIGAFFNWLFRQ